jgi:hypothetical protein
MFVVTVCRRFSWFLTAKCATSVPRWPRPAIAWLPPAFGRCIPCTSGSRSTPKPQSAFRPRVRFAMGLVRLPPSAPWRQSATSRTAPTAYRPPSMKSSDDDYAIRKTPFSDRASAHIPTDYDEEENSGRCRTRTCGPLRVKQEGAGHKPLENEEVTNDSASRCTNCCTKNKNPSQNDPLQGLVRAFRELSPDERVMLIARLIER